MKLLSLLLLVVVAAGCSRPETARPAPSLPPMKAQLAVVQVEELPRLTEIAGTVRPVRRAVLAAKVTGAVSELQIALGQPVKAGEVLLRIFSADLSARLTQARVQLNVARRDFAREQELMTKGASTAETVRNLQDQVLGAEAAVRDAEVQLGYAELRAPFAGVIARRMVNAGDFAVAGQPLVEVEGTDEFEVEAAVPESLAAALQVGTPLSCVRAATPFTATVKEKSSAADPATRSVGVKLAVPDAAGVRSGEFVRIQVPGPASRVLLVPATAVSVHGQMERVFVAGDDRRATLRLVRTGAVRDGRVEILSGLSAGERVVVTAGAGLRDGQPLEVQP